MSPGLEGPKVIFGWDDGQTPSHPSHAKTAEDAKHSWTDKRATNKGLDLLSLTVFCRPEDTAKAAKAITASRKNARFEISLISEYGDRVVPPAMPPLILAYLDTYMDRVGIWDPTNESMYSEIRPGEFQAPSATNDDNARSTIPSSQIDRHPEAVQNWRNFASHGAIVDEGRTSSSTASSLCSPRSSLPEPCCHLFSSRLIDITTLKRLSLTSQNKLV
ncbi:unnamed protein product [Penicillium bialowiezense]